MTENYKGQSPARQGLKRLPTPSGAGYKLVVPVSVARVRPRTSKGITDLLLLPTSSNLDKASPSKKQIFYSKNYAI